MSRAYRELTTEEAEALELDPTKMYHYTGKGYKPEICGELVVTDRWGTIHSASVRILVCKTCGKETEVSSYDRMWIGPDVDQSELSR